MTLGSYVRGNLVTFDDEAGLWRYEDGVAVDEEPDRPCVRCGRPPTPEGYDACMGLVPGARSVCCGHGVHTPILIMEGDHDD